MTLQETAIIMDILTAAYPQFYRGMPKDDLKKAAVLWADLFKDDPVQNVAAAVKAFISNDRKGYPPAIGLIKEQLFKITQPEQMSEAEAWNVVLKALRNSAYRADEEFKKLPPLLKRIVGSPSTLRDWCQQEYETLSVTASNFQRSYRTMAVNEKEYIKLPNDIKELISGIVKSLPGEEDSHNLIALERVHHADRY